MICKRRKISKGEALRKAIDFTKETGFDDAYVAGVTHAEIVEYFDGKSMEELEKMDVEGICIAKSFVGLIRIYTRNEDGGGAGVHPSVSLVHSPSPPPVLTWHVSIGTKILARPGDLQ